MDKRLRDRRISMVAAAGLLACLVTALGLAQTSNDTPAATDFVYAEVTTDPFGACEIPDDIAPGQRVECLVTLGLKRDMGRAVGILESSPLEAWTVVPERLPPRGFPKGQFDFENADVTVKDPGHVFVSFTMPKDVLEVDLHFVVSLEGGTVLRETAERNATVAYYKRDAQTIQLKAFAKH